MAATVVGIRSSLVRNAYNRVESNAENRHATFEHWILHG